MKTAEFNNIIISILQLAQRKSPNNIEILQMVNKVRLINSQNPGCLIDSSYKYIIDYQDPILRKDSKFFIMLMNHETSNKDIFETIQQLYEIIKAPEKEWLWRQIKELLEICIEYS